MRGLIFQIGSQKIFIIIILPSRTILKMQRFMVEIQDGIVKVMILLISQFMGQILGLVLIQIMMAPGLVF